MLRPLLCCADWWLFAPGHEHAANSQQTCWLAGGRCPPGRVLPLPSPPLASFQPPHPAPALPSVFTAVVEAAEAQQDSGVTQVRFAKLNLIDLAGECAGFIWGAC